MMRMWAARAAIGLAAGALLWSAAANALGLGEVEVRSRLNERFSATIPLVSATPADLESLVISIASPEDFARSGVDRADAISGLSFARAGDGIRISSREAIRDPFLTFIVEARWNGGRLLREYTVLLDPPEAAAAVSPPAAEAAPARALVLTPPKPAAVPPVAAPSPAAPATVVATPQAGEGRYGPVRPGQTLWSVARAVIGESGVSLEQMVLALYAANPKAFVGGDIDQLAKGSLLKVPTADEARVVDAVTARVRVNALRDRAPAGATTAVPPATPIVATPVAPAPAPVPAPEATLPKPVPDATAAKSPAVAPASAEPVPAAPAAEPLAAAPDAPPADLSPSEVPATDVLPAPEAMAEPVPPPAPPAKDPDLQIIDRPAVAAPAADEALPVSLPLIGGLAALILLLIAIKLRRRKPGTAASAPRAAPAAEARPAGADASMDRRVAPRLADDALAAASKPLPPADDVEPEPLAEDAEREAAADRNAAASLGLGNVDAADPMTEADFHLAYGLYDEAAQMLKTAIAADPARSELKVKLAEVYSASGNAAEFRTLAEGIVGQLNPAQWQKVSALGRAILPDMALFQEGGESPSASAPSPSPAVVPPAPQPEAMSDLSVIDFDLASDAPFRDRPAAAPAETPEPLREALLAPFDEAPLPPMEAADAGLSPALDVPPPAAPPAAPDTRAALDVASFGLDDVTSGPSAGLATDAGRVEFTIDDLEAVAAEPLTLEPESEVIGGDEIDTKLDLARAYADMGDAEAARGLLDEVLAGGNDKQQQDARALRQRLAG